MPPRSTDPAERLPSNKKTTNTRPPAPEEIYEAGGLTTQRSVPQDTSTAPALISFTTEGPLSGDKCRAASNFKDRGSRLPRSGATRARETHDRGHMARRDRGWRDRCTHRCTDMGQTCPSARGRAAGEEMQIPTVAFLPSPLPIGSPYILQEFYCGRDLAVLSEG